ncbi:MAG: phospholipid carrier-dependent glycosyltransferase [Anaerolineae bacterium]|nr:phospholipid carrier-dependent glycosyltransferase [Anaerolineae bacterium]
MPGKLNPKYQRRLLALCLGLFLFSIYLFSYRGGFHSIDEVAMYAVTESLAKFGRFNIDQIAWIQWTTTQAEAQGFFGQDGHVYSKKGLALSLAQVPFYWLALHLPGIGMLQTVSLLNVVITAATGLLIFMFLHRLNFSTQTCVVTALIFGLATIAAVYAKYLFSEPLAGLLLLLAAYMLFAYGQEGGLRHVVIAGLAAGFAVVTRANNLFTLPVFGLYLIWITGRPVTKVQRDHGPQTAYSVFRILYLALRSVLIPLVVFIAALAIPGLILMGYNAIRSGNPFDTGYDLALFSPNILLGLYKLLFSPLRGLFVYTPILLLSLPGWWYLRKTHPAEAWLLAGLVGITLVLFSAWSSGEGLSWGSRFLVPVIPFFLISLAPMVEKTVSSGVANSSMSWLPPSSSFHRGENPPTFLPLGGIEEGLSTQTGFTALRLTFYALLLLSLLIQFLGIAINPWIFLARLQEKFGGEFFLEKTAALYNFRYNQIAGQIQAWSLQNSDVAWWQPWGFDGLAFGLSLVLVLFSGWLLWQQLAAHHRPSTATKKFTNLTPHPSSFTLYASLLLLPAIITYALLARYYHTDRQFGPPDDTYTRALNTAASRGNSDDQIATVAQYHYHVPMNRFKASIPLTGFAQQSWPLPQTALPLLRDVTAGSSVWLVTVGFQPAAASNAAEQWLTFNTFKVSDEWLDGSVRLARYATQKPKTIRPINATLGQAEVQLAEVNLVETIQPGATLPVEFFWLALDQPQADYNLFLQLLDMDGTLIAQHDNPPNGGYTPTSTWQPGQPVTTRHALALPADLAPGEYQLIAGLYHPVTGVRLAVASGGDWVNLGSVTIKR